MEFAQEQADLPSSRPDESPKPEDVLRELNLILASAAFRQSKRSQEFLAFVVRYGLEGNSEQLKERVIGATIFRRSAAYDTGSDSVVRVQAGEVRRRLHLYYETRPAASRVLVDLPVGSYTPVFSLFTTAHGTASPVVNAETAVQEPSREPVEEEALVAQEVVPTSLNRKRGLWWLAGLGLAAAASLAAWTLFGARSDLDRFWTPVVAPRHPILIYLPKLLCYRPTDQLYRRTAKSPGEFSAAFDRLNFPPHLGPNDSIRWGEMYVDNDQGPGIGDIKASILLSKYLLARRVESDVRIGSEFTFEDMKGSSTVLIGAFSDRWTLQMLKDQHYSFEDEGDHTVTRVKGGKGEKWLIELDRLHNTLVDYGLVTRLVNPKTGQFTIAVAGIGSSGSEAAAEVITNPEVFAKALANAPEDWSKKNIQIAVKVLVTDSINGPPVVVGAYFW